MLYRVPEFLLSRLRWDPSPTIPQASVSPPHLGPSNPTPQASVAPPPRVLGGGRRSRLREREWRDPIQTTGQKFWYSILYNLSTREIIVCG
jgi:hypothetical protein